MTLSRKEFNKRMLQPKKRVIPRKEVIKCCKCGRAAAYSEHEGRAETGKHWCRLHVPSDRKASH